MITVKQQEKLINRFETLSELELDSVLSELTEVITRNRMNHLVERHFDFEDLEAQNHELSEQVEDLEREVKELEDSSENLGEISNLCEEADEVEDFEEGAFEKLKKLISKIKELT